MMCMFILFSVGPSTIHNGGTPTVQGNDILTPMLASEMDNLGLGDASVTTNVVCAEKTGVICGMF